MKNSRLLLLAAALGYFVDIYDLVLFNVIRRPSLSDLGLTSEAQFTEGLFLLDMQMAGMLLGGIFWGVLGDRKGRVTVLFGSILMYSLANIANGFVTNIPVYATLRFLAGVGLAGELGAGITLVSETMPPRTRGYGTTLVATVGILGAVAAALVGGTFPWRTAYFVGGGLGLLLLFFRLGAYESGLYEAIKTRTHMRGEFLLLFRRPLLRRRYLSIILVGIPIWYGVSILTAFSPEIGSALGMTEPPDAGRSILFCYLGLALGDLASGALSQLLGSRKRVLALFLVLTAGAVANYFVRSPLPKGGFYSGIFFLGLATGYWAVFVTVASELFGTNIRATATTTAPNFVRGSVVLLTTLFKSLKEPFGIVRSAELVGILVLVLAFVALRGFEETHGKDLDFVDG